MQRSNRKFDAGFSMIELITTLGISTILMLVVGTLLVSGNRSWHQSYDSAHKQIKEDAQDVMLAFGSMGRRANRLGYIIYNKDGETFTPAEPQTSNPEEVVSGDAVEFRYWDVELDTDDTHNLMDVTKTGTAYSFFYVDDSQLKIDYGPYPPGAVPSGGGNRNTSNVTTHILANNVTTDPGIGAFSHTTISETGQGSVRINIILTDPNDDDSIKVMTATLMRNIWPR